MFLFGIVKYKQVSHQLTRFGSSSVWVWCHAKFMLGSLGYFKIIAIDPLEKEKITLLKVDQTLYFESYKLVVTFV